MRSIWGRRGKGSFLGINIIVTKPLVKKVYLGLPKKSLTMYFTKKISKALLL